MKEVRYWIRKLLRKKQYAHRGVEVVTALMMHVPYCTVTTVGWTKPRPRLLDQYTRIYFREGKVCFEFVKFYVGENNRTWPDVKKWAVHYRIKPKLLLIYL